MKTFEEKQRGFIDELITIGNITVRDNYFRGKFSEKSVAGFIDEIYFDVYFRDNTVIVANNTDCKKKINKLLIKHKLNDTERQD